MPAKRSLVVSQMLDHVVKLVPLPEFVTSIDNIRLCLSVLFHHVLLSFRHLFLLDPLLVILVKKRELL